MVFVGNDGGNTWIPVIILVNTAFNLKFDGYDNNVLPDFMLVTISSKLIDASSTSN